jgi:hypothetical protein
MVITKRELPKKKKRRIIRKLRYLLKRGSLFKRKIRPAVEDVIVIIPNPVPVKKRSRISMWRIYRRMRYLYRKGSLFKFQLPKKPSPPQPEPVVVVKKRHSPFNLRVTYRKVRYLIHRGSLFKKNEQRPWIFYWNSGKIIRTFTLPYWWLYTSYRKLRYLAHTGKLFERKKQEKIKKGTGLKFLRKIRFLLYKGTFFRDRTKSQVRRKRFWNRHFGFLRQWRYIRIIINSTILFLLSHTVVFLITSFGASFMATNFHIKSIIYYHKTDYLIRSVEWKGDAIVNVFSTGPFLALGIATLSLFLFAMVIYQRWLFNLFLLWLFCQGLVHFLGEVSAGLILSKGLGFAIRWSYYSDFTQLVFIYTSFLILLATGFVLTRTFMLTGNYYFNEIGPGNRNSFVKSQYIFPFFIGMIIMTLAQLPKLNIFDTIVNFTMFFMLLPVLMRSKMLMTIYFDEEDRNPRTIWWLVIAGVIITIVFYIVFGEGVRIE